LMRRDVSKGCTTSRGFFATFERLPSIWSKLAWKYLSLSAIGIRRFILDINPLDSSPGQLSLPFYMVQDLSRFHRHHPLIYCLQYKKRSTVNVYKSDGGRWVRVRRYGL